MDTSVIKARTLRLNLGVLLLLGIALVPGQHTTTADAQGLFPSPLAVSPIFATATPPVTTYVALFDNPGGHELVARWSGATCGVGPLELVTNTERTRGTFSFAWSHPHPPCDPTLDHSTETIVLRVSSAGSLDDVVCSYQGALSGTGPGCTTESSLPEPPALPAPGLHAAAHILLEPPVNITAPVGPGLPSGLIGDPVHVGVHNSFFQPVDVNILAPDGAPIFSPPATVEPNGSFFHTFTPDTPGIFGLEVFTPGPDGPEIFSRDALGIFGQPLTPDMADTPITEPWLIIQTGPDQAVTLHQTLVGPDADGEAYRHIGPNSTVAMGTYADVPQEGPYMPPVTTSVVAPGAIWRLHTSTGPSDTLSSAPFQGQTTTTLQPPAIDAPLQPWGAVIFTQPTTGFTIYFSNPGFHNSSFFYTPDEGWHPYTFISTNNIGEGSQTVSVQFFNEGGAVVADPIYRNSIEETSEGSLFVADAAVGTLTVRHEGTGQVLELVGPHDPENPETVTTFRRVTVTEGGDFSDVTQHAIDDTWPQVLLDLYSSSAACTDIPLVVGLNFVALPHTPAGAYTASTLAAEIAGQGGLVDQIDRWDKTMGRWESHKVGLSFNDFSIVPGEAYFLKVTQAATWSFCGQALTESVPVELVVGLNGVAVPYPTGTYTASTLAARVAEQGGVVDQIDMWDQAMGRWTSHKVGFLFNDFPIEAWRGYFLKVTKAGTLTP